MRLEEAVGMRGSAVVYRPYPEADGEDGTITGTSDRFVFVRYRGQHPGADGQATPPETLEWL